MTAEFGLRQPGIRYVSRPGAYGIARRHGRVAVVVTPRGWFLPGGGIRPGETPTAALAREVAEETGRSVRVLEFVAEAVEYVHAPPHDTGFAKQSRFYLVRIGPDRGNPAEPDHELRWPTPEEAAVGLAHASQAWAVELALARPAAPEAES